MGGIFLTLGYFYKKQQNSKIVCLLTNFNPAKMGVIRSYTGNDSPLSCNPMCSKVIRFRLVEPLLRDYCEPTNVGFGGGHHLGIGYYLRFPPKIIRFKWMW